MTWNGFIEKQKTFQHCIVQSFFFLLHWKYFTQVWSDGLKAIRMSSSYIRIVVAVYEKDRKRYQKCWTDWHSWHWSGILISCWDHCQWWWFRLVSNKTYLTYTRVPTIMITVSKGLMKTCFIEDIHKLQIVEKLLPRFPTSKYMKRFFSYIKKYFKYKIDVKKKRESWTR